jgi:hypothetical protein
VLIQHGRKSRILGHGWGAWLALGLASAGLAAAGCGSSFESCLETRTCPVADSASGAGGEDATPSGGSGAVDTGGGSGTAGTGANPSCDEGLDACGAECVDTQTDAAHCGSCKNACAVDAICEEGACVACPAGNIGCDGQCVDPMADTEFCGASGACEGEARGTACAQGALCSSGQCVSDDASLKSLSLTPAALAPAFSPSTLAYEASFAYFEPHLSLAASPASSDAKVTLDGKAFDPAEGLQVTATPEEDAPALNLEVTAESGKKQAYGVTLKRAALATTYFKAFNSRKEFAFGSSVAIDRDTVVVGAPAEDSYTGGVDGNESSTGATGAGAAYVAFRGANGKWTRQAYLKADNPAQGDEFGTAVAVAGDTIAVGAPFKNDGAGAVYVFARTGTGWAQQAMITEPSSETSNWFGSAVALTGDQLIVSTPRSNAIAYQAGAVYSFTRTGSTWKADAKHPSPAAAKLTSYAGFGYRLSLSGDRVAVSEERATGSVFVMLRSGSSWTLEQAVTLSGSAFTEAKVALDADTLAVSAPGVVHVLTRSGSVWSKQVSLNAFNAAATNGFGASLALQGDLLVVGSGCIGPTCKGALSTFVRDGATWKSGAFVTPANLEQADSLGASVAVSGTRIVAGAPGEDSNSTSFNQSAANNLAPQAGAAFIFE